MKTKNKDLFSSPLWSDAEKASAMLDKIEDLSAALSRRGKKNINIMEVCGTHTMAIASTGIRGMLPSGVNLLSGPGCPVCVTSAGDIDGILALSEKKGLIIATFGDMLKVRGSDGKDLNSIRAGGGDIRVVYSPLDALELAVSNPDRKVVFVGVGFETTAPLIASVLKTAAGRGVDNFFVTSLFKLVPPALELLLENKISAIDAFLLPGHVSAIIGVKPYSFVPQKYKIPCSIAGFEPLDILRGVNVLLSQIYDNKPEVEVEYSRVVAMEGNPVAKEITAEVFREADASWRAIGKIKKSGLALNKNYARFDAFSAFGIKVSEKPEPPGCLCGKILLGKAIPSQCPYFGTRCTPLEAIGPCMVSSEGACAAWYKYGVKK